MKYFFILFFLIASIVGGVYYFLFTSGGNDLIRPYLSSFISKKSGNNFDIYIKKFRLTT